MATDFPPLNAAQAWHPLPANEWNPDRARHLLRRAGWSAQPDEVEQAIRDGLPATLARLFPSTPPTWPRPDPFDQLEKDWHATKESMRLLDEPAKRQERNRLREKFRDATRNLSIEWLQRARKPASAAFEKWLLFLSDVYVVTSRKVDNPLFLFEHLAILRAHALGSAPTLTKAVSRSPAMIMMLDLQQSRRDAPNENFARELFELFILGEGHYTENDIKEAARAFVGYRQRDGEFAFMRGEGDSRSKSVFGHKGHFWGDEVIDLAYLQPGAATFLPQELIRFYLTDDEFPADWIQALGAIWKDAGFELRQLALTFFGSRAFFQPAFCGNYIKSPVQYYLGILQDLGTDVMPAARFTLNPLRGMGQTLFDPPNIRGWVGGRQWINSTTLAARSQIARSLVEGTPLSVLNADERAAAEAAMAQGHGPFWLTPEGLTALIADGPAPDHVLADWFKRWLPSPPPPGAVRALHDFLSHPSDESWRYALITLLQSPDYNLC